MKIILRISLVALSAYSTVVVAKTGARGSKGTALPLSTGIAFTSSADATFLNPASLADGSMSNVRGVWMVDTEEALAHVTGASGSAGFGAGYWRLAPATATDQTANFFEFGLGVNMSNVKLGLSLNTTDGDGLDGDVGINFDLSKVRLAFAARGISGPMDRLDFGIGFYESQYRFEIDIKKVSPFDDLNTFFDSFLFDFGLAIQTHPFTFSLGTDFSYADGSFSGLDFHAALDIALTKAFSLQGHYRPWVQERGGNEWVAGVRFIF